MHGPRTAEVHDPSSRGLKVEGGGGGRRRREAWEGRGGGAFEGGGGFQRGEGWGFEGGLRKGTCSTKAPPSTFTCAPSPWPRWSPEGLGLIQKKARRGPTMIQGPSRPGAEVRFSGGPDSKTSQVAPRVQVRCFESYRRG